jgi:hypothetical protein
MNVFDCNLSFGRYPSDGPYKPCDTADEMCGELGRAGISGGLVRHAAADLSGAATGNGLLAEALRRDDFTLWGVWTLLPSCTGEIPPPKDLPDTLAERGMRAVRMNPRAHRYLPLPEVIGDYLEVLAERRIPVHFSTGCGVSLEQVFTLMSTFPKLTAILTHADCWPNDRLLRPYLERFPNFYLDTAYLLTDQGFESMAGKYGASRLLFGSGFPEAYLGAHMLTIRHSELSGEDKEAILGGNLLRIVKGAMLE